MKPVGIIPNPASGKDIRRLVAYGSVFDNNEKVNIVRRVILGLDAMGVKDVLIMPDYFGIGVRAIEDLKVSLRITFLDMKMDNTPSCFNGFQLIGELPIFYSFKVQGFGNYRTVTIKVILTSPLAPKNTEGWDDQNAPESVAHFHRNFRKYQQSQLL